ncbi:MAG TPA: RHS repeat-associated core domain-containing protein, partial [Nitrososphaerales archaeon]|nr:RHS repeat-associated core domain-containing protein [Nitrososphaerales archaeon]
TRIIAANYIYFFYSSSYSSAYITKQSILVGTQNVTTTYTYNSTMGFRLSQTDPNGQTTSYRYDLLGRVIRVTYPSAGGVVAYVYRYYYDGNNTMKTIDENGHITKQYFDGLARQTKVQKWNGSSVYSAETYTYNWVDEVAKKTTGTNNTYAYSYDWNGRLTKLTNPDTTYSTTSYDDVKNMKNIADERGHKTVYVYDWNQRLKYVNEYNSTSTHYTTIYTYDLSGNQLSSKDGKNQTTSYLYDDLNRLNTTTFPTSPSTKEERSYDSVGNLLTRITANGSKISYTYDGLNRLTKVTYPGSGGTVVYTYDAASNGLSMVNPSSSDYYTYDARNRLTNSTEYVGGTKYQTLYSFDKASNVVQTTYPDSYALSMTYDGVNRLKTVGSYATIGYTVDDKISKVTYGNGEVATYSYDTRDRPTRILDKYGSTKEMDLNYTYDGTGNVLTLNTEAYHYDWLNRLNYSSGPWTTITYAFDPVGNRVKMVQGTTTTYTYGPFNRLSSAGSTSYTYDANGNMITKTGGWTYSYDYENRLTKAVQSGTTVQQNSYDGGGNRVKQVAGSSTFTYSYQGLNILYEKNVTGGTTTVTKHFYAGSLQVAKMVGSTAYYLHQDALGSTRLVATSSVTIKFSSNYLPYGNNYGISGKEVFMYTGKPYDSVTGLYYEGARYYDSSTGRFVTEDSVTGTQEDPQSLNRYVYARDNPMKIVDLAGHEWWNPVAALTSAGSAIVGGVSQVASAVTNAWNSLPPSTQDTILIGAAVAVTVVTAGAAAPVILAAGVAVGVGATATYAGYTTATGGTITGQGLLNSFTTGFLVGTAVGGVASAVGLLSSGAETVSNVFSAGKSVDAALEDFPSGLTTRTLTEDMPATRYFGGSTGMVGRFFTTDSFSSSAEAIEKLDLPMGNTAQKSVSAIITQGSTVYEGLTSGGASQVYLYAGKVLWGAIESAF